MTLKHYILEIQSRQPLYHFTTSDNLINILKTNILKPSLTLTNTGEQNDSKYISLTRKYDFAKEWEHMGDTRLTLHTDKLRNNYKIIPHDERIISYPEERQYWKEEQEERILVEGKEGITNLDRYLIQIDIMDEWYEDYLHYYDHDNIQEIINEAKKLTNVTINLVNKWKPYK